MWLLKENPSQTKVSVGLALHIPREANLRHLSSGIFLAHQKAWPAVLSSTNMFRHWVCTKNSIRYREVTEMNEARTEPLKTLNLVGRKDKPTTLYRAEQTMLHRWYKRGALEALEKEQ